MTPVAPRSSQPLGSRADEPMQSAVNSVRQDGIATTGAGPITAEAARLRKAAQDFESVFLRQMLSGLEKTTQVSSGGKSNAAQSTYGSMVVESVADAVAKAGGLGIGDLLVRSLSSRLDQSAISQAGSNTPPQSPSVPASRPIGPRSQSHKESEILPQGLSPLAVPRAEIRTSNVPITGLLADRRIR